MVTAREESFILSIKTSQVARITSSNDIPTTHGHIIDVKARSAQQAFSPKRISPKTGLTHLERGAGIGPVSRNRKTVQAPVDYDPSIAKSRPTKEIPLFIQSLPLFMPYALWRCRSF